MNKVITYKKSKHQCFCQIKLDSGERILISIATAPKPNIKVLKLLLGIIPIRTVWEFNPTMAGGYHAYIDKLMKMFLKPQLEEVTYPLDAIRDKLLPCKSIEEARRVLLEIEKSISN